MTAMLERDTLELIQETAVKAAESETYELGRRRTLRIDRSGAERIIEKEPPEVKNVVLTIEDAIRVFRKHEAATIWVLHEHITIVHDDVVRWGKTLLPVWMSNAAKILAEADLDMKTMSPEEFEKIAMLRFGCDPSFIQTLRNLQWNQESKESAQISNVNKSISATELAKVLRRDGTPFEDVSISVVTPVFEIPFKTKEIAIEVSVIANAQTKKISFAPVPGVMALIVREATRELFDAVCEGLTGAERERVYMGRPE